YSENQHSSYEKDEGEINSSTDVGVAETDFMDNSPPSMEHSVHKENEFSADPFGLNELLGIKKNPIEEILKLSPSLSHPTGFSPEVVSKARGSVLGVLEEMIRVGRAMGYSMEGCEKDIEFIINSKGDESVFK
nr:hypothetical protein [Tanacetum cinerariifolium]